jgi:hypothetical protein
LVRDVLRLGVDHDVSGMNGLFADEVVNGQVAVFGGGREKSSLL